MSFTKLVEKNRERFQDSLKNIQLTYGCGDDIVGLYTNFPHIYKKLSILFATKDCSNYIDDLVVQDRNRRQGFPSAMWSLLQKIKTENEKFYKENKKTDVWDII